LPFSAVSTNLCFYQNPPNLTNMTTRPLPDPTKAGGSPTWWICAALVLSVAAAYWPVTGCVFTDYDEPQYVFKNPQVLHGLTWPGVVWAFGHFHSGNWHPLTWLSHMLDVQLFGLRPGWHHATNLVCHAANTVLLFLWLRRLTSFVWRSAVVAALFGLHPLHVESVAWVAERKDVLSTFFLLLSLMAYTRYVQSVTSGKWQVTSGKPVVPSPVTRHPSLYYVLTLVSFALGLMSKPMVVTLPFVLLLLDWWPLGRVSSFKFQVSSFLPLLLEKIPFFALSAGSCVVTFLAQQSSKAVAPFALVPVGDRLANTFTAYAGYLGKMLWPEPLAACYPLNLPVDMDWAILAAGGLLLVSGTVWFFRRQQPWLVTGWLWYLGTLVPVIGLVQVGSQAMADRYTYVPLIGIFIALVWLVAQASLKWPYRRPVLAVISVIVLAACWQRTTVQAGYWQNSETLARHALAVTPANSPMQLLLGDALMDHGKPEEAGEHFAEAVRICPDNVPALCGQAMAADVQGKLSEAADICQAALKLLPRDPKIHYIFGNTLSAQGKLPEAIAEYQAALKYDPKQILAMNDLAWLLATASDARYRDGAEAVRLAESACELSNHQVALYMGTLGAAYAEAGRFADAVKTAQSAVALATAEKKPALIKKNRELLELYQAGQPYHEPARRPEPPPAQPGL
jgi:Flp pilus assembly protein TadD